MRQIAIYGKGGIASDVSRRGVKMDTLIFAFASAYSAVALPYSAVRATEVTAIRQDRFVSGKQEV
jgi:hypothetical protein